MIIAQTSGDTDTVTDLLHLAFIVGMAALLVGGIVALLVLWYVRGRDPAIDKVAEYITEPPDDLPPGAAGTLLDEHADHHDVVATLLGLARSTVSSRRQMILDITRSKTIFEAVQKARKAGLL